MADIEEFRHEVQDFSEYDSTFTNHGNAIAITEAAALAGSGWGMAVTASGTQDGSLAYGFKAITLTGNTVRFRIYIDFNSLVMAANDNFFAVYIRFNFIALVGLNIRWNGSNYTAFAYAWDDSQAFKNAPAGVISDDPHFIEIEFKRSTSKPAVDGHLKIWLDETLKATTSNIDFHDKDQPNELFIGGFSVDAGTSSTFYVDEFKLNDDGSEIGPLILNAGLLQRNNLGKVLIR